MLKHTSPLIAFPAPDSNFASTCAVKASISISANGDHSLKTREEMQ